MSRIVLIGHPVAHSLSPVMHNAAFAALGLPHRYGLLDVRTAGLAAAVDALRRDDALGANITIPHKEAALGLIDEVGGDVRRIGALNTIARRGSRLVGHNTDADGFSAALEASKGDLLVEDSVLVLGAGGAARACVFVLLTRGNRVAVASRTRERADRLATDVVVAGRRATVVAWPRGTQDLRPYQGVVNATPLGLQDEDPLEGIALPRVVVDIVPTLAPTPLVRRARAANVTVVDGLAMLLHQAARSFALWTGVPAPLDVMRAALARLG